METTSLVRGIVELESKARTVEKERENPKPEQPSDYTAIESEIADMMQENTGAHILDSGFAYGRHWEKNRETKDFREQPTMEVKTLENGFYVTYNIFHYLTKSLAVTEKANKVQVAFEEFLEKNKDLSYLEAMEEFTNNPVSNTYNRETILSQTLQYVLFSSDGRSEAELYECDLILLQIHNGCDVRGGYTKPRVFELGVEPSYFLFAQSDINACCDCSFGYSDDAGYNWHDRPEMEVEDERVVCSECGSEVEFTPTIPY